MLLSTPADNKKKNDWRPTDCLPQKTRSQVYVVARRYICVVSVALGSTTKQPTVECTVTRATEGKSHIRCMACDSPTKTIASSNLFRYACCSYIALRKSPENRSLASNFMSAGVGTLRHLSDLRIQNLRHNFK